MRIKQYDTCTLLRAYSARVAAKITSSKRSTHRVQKQLTRTLVRKAKKRPIQPYCEWQEVREWAARRAIERAYEKLVCEYYEKYWQGKGHMPMPYSKVRPVGLQGYLQVRKTILRNRLDIRIVDTKSIVDIIQQLVAMEECHIFLIQCVLRVKIREWENYVLRTHLIPPKMAMERAYQLFDLMHTPWYFAPGYTHWEYCDLMDTLGVSAYFNQFVFDYTKLYYLKHLYYAHIYYGYIGWFAVSTTPTSIVHDVVLRSAQNFKKGRAKMRGSWSTRKVLLSAYTTREHIRLISQNITVGAAYILRKSVVANLRELYDW